MASPNACAACAWYYVLSTQSGRAATFCTRENALCGPDYYLAVQWPSTWLSEKGPDDFKNPMRSILFLGDDENGDLIPTRALRDRLKQQRRDVFPPPPP